jgi:hypothetical protein
VGHPAPHLVSERDLDLAAAVFSLPETTGLMEELMEDDERET